MGAGYESRLLPGSKSVGSALPSTLHPASLPLDTALSQRPVRFPTLRSPLFLALPVVLRPSLLYRALTSINRTAWFGNAPEAASCTL